jgi:hypothetical protein
MVGASSVFPAFLPIHALRPILQMPKSDQPGPCPRPAFGQCLFFCSLLQPGAYYTVHRLRAVIQVTALHKGAAFDAQSAMETALSPAAGTAELKPHPSDDRPWRRRTLRRRGETPDSAMARAKKMTAAAADIAKGFAGVERSRLRWAKATRRLPGAVERRTTLGLGLARARNGRSGREMKL